MDIVNETKKIFGPIYEEEAALVSKIIEKNRWTIIECGSCIEDFVKYCKIEITSHYEKYPEDKFNNIYFKKKNLGYDNWVVDPVFNYSVVSIEMKEL